MYGLTGTVQTGKQELDEVFAEHGIRFINLNIFSAEFRAENKEEYYRLGFKHADFSPLGRRWASYYERFAEIPGLFEKVKALEWPHMIGETKRVLARVHGTAILSWEYLADCQDELPVGHMILAAISTEKLLERLTRKLFELKRDRAAANEEMLKLLRQIRLEPERIQAQVEAVMGTRYTVVDTGGDDWGEEAMRKFLRELKF